MIYVGHLSLIRERMKTDSVGLSRLSTSPPYLHEPSTVLSLCLISRLAEGRQETMACFMAVSGSKNWGMLAEKKCLSTASK